MKKKKKVDIILYPYRNAKLFVINIYTYTHSSCPSDTAVKLVAYK